MRITLVQQLRDGFHSPLPVLSLPGHLSLQITEQERSSLSGEGTSVGAHAAGATGPTTPQLGAIPAKALPTLSTPSWGQGWEAPR